MSELTPDLISKIGKDYSDVLSEEQRYLVTLQIEEFEKKLQETDIKNKSDEELDVLYGDLKTEQRACVKTINELQFDFELSAPQVKLLRKLLVEKGRFSLSDNTIWLAEKLKGWLINLPANVVKDTYMNYQITCSESVMLYSLLNSSFVEGIGKEFSDFIEILKKIGGISICYAEFHRKSEEIDVKFQDLFAYADSLNDGMSSGDTEKMEYQN